MEPSPIFDLFYYSYSSEEIVGGVYSIPIYTALIGIPIVRMRVGEMGTKTGVLDPIVGYVQTRVKEWLCMKRKEHGI